MTSNDLHHQIVGFYEGELDKLTLELNQVTDKCGGMPDGPTFKPYPYARGGSRTRRSSSSTPCRD